MGQCHRKDRRAPEEEEAGPCVDSDTEYESADEEPSEWPGPAIQTVGVDLNRIAVRPHQCAVYGGDGKRLPAAANLDRDPIWVSGPHFEGRMVLRVLGLEPATAYFEGKTRRMAIQLQGRFRHPVNADELEFGAAFDRPIELPWGASVGLALARAIDPALREDLAGPRPWLMSPLLCAMSRIKASTVGPGDGMGAWQYGGAARLEEDSGLLMPPAERSRRGLKFQKRRRFFGEKTNREDTVIRPDQLLEMEFHSPMLDLSEFKVSLGLWASLEPYLKGQPVRFEARYRGEALFGAEFMSPNENGD